MAMSLSETREYLAEGKKLKEEGTKAFKARDWQKALAHYTKVFLWVNGLNPTSVAEATASLDVKKAEEIPKDLADEILECRVSANINCAVCYLKLGRDLDRAVDFCNRALELDKENKKAVYRRGQAYLAMKDLDNAERDLNAAKAAFPTDKGVKEDLATLTQLFKQHAKKEKRVFAGLFDKLARQQAKEEADASKSATAATASTVMSSSSLASPSTTHNDQAAAKDSTCTSCADHSSH